MILVLCIICIIADALFVHTGICFLTILTFSAFLGTGQATVQSSDDNYCTESWNHRWEISIGKNMHVRHNDPYCGNRGDVGGVCSVFAACSVVYASPILSVYLSVTLVDCVKMAEHIIRLFIA